MANVKFGKYLFNFCIKKPEIKLCVDLGWRRSKTKKMKKKKKSKESNNGEEAKQRRRRRRKAAGCESMEGRGQGKRKNQLRQAHRVVRLPENRSISRRPRPPPHLTPSPRLPPPRRLLRPPGLE
ncbi:uncharacterized protein LOC126785257 [Argentina anserina]|uniref:uncharacterized protein LOC126785257 n=1 Tax=Argentina anserina TaxID=57926 RepID=UPI0021766AA3|nr:uncharacterized protein LOC126785257 [Potentilla anserina]